MKKNILGEMIGWYGTITIVSAYALVSFGVMSASSLIYQMLNMTGALGIVYIASKKKDYQSSVLNIIWVIIALIAIVNILHIFN